MSNEMTIPTADQLPAHLQKARAQSTALDEFVGGVAGGFPLAFLSVRGKEFRLRKGGQEVNTRQRELSVILVAARPTLSKRYYAKAYESGTTEAPDCSSADAITPDVPEPINPMCGTCPKNAFGSGVDQSGNPTKGKACQDYKRLIVWPVGLTDDPFVLDVTASSFRAPKGQSHNVLMLRDYMDVLAKHNMDPTMVVTKLAFTDAEYPQLCFAFERFVSEDEWARVQELRGEDTIQEVIGKDIHEPARQIEEKTAEPAKQEARAEPTSEPVKEAKPAPEPEPEPAAEPAKEGPAASGSDDLFSEIEKLLGGSK